MWGWLKLELGSRRNSYPSSCKGWYSSHTWPLSTFYFASGCFGIRIGFTLLDNGVNSIIWFGILSVEFFPIVGRQSLLPIQFLWPLVQFFILRWELLDKFRIKDNGCLWSPVFVECCSRRSSKVIGVPTRLSRIKKWLCSPYSITTKFMSYKIWLNRLRWWAGQLIRMGEDDAAWKVYKSNIP